MSRVRGLGSCPGVGSSERGLESWPRLVSSVRVLGSCPWLVSFVRSLGTFPRFVSSVFVFVSCLRSLSSAPVLGAPSPLLTPDPRLQPEIS